MVFDAGDCARTDFFFLKSLLSTSVCHLSVVLHSFRLLELMFNLNHFSNVNKEV